MDMLPYLDFNRLAALPAKWVCGYSDISTLTFALTLNSDIAAIHGSNSMNMGYTRIHDTDMRVFEAMSACSIEQKVGKHGEVFQVGMIFRGKSITSTSHRCGSLYREISVFSLME